MGYVADYLRKKIHSILLKQMPSRITVPIKVLNDMAQVSGNKLFAINHSCVLDAPVSGWVIKEHFYYLIGKQRLQIIDRIFFHLNGVVIVDRKNREHKKKCSQKMLKLLNEGKSLLICPEGTWNLTPSKPMLPLNWGIIDLAKQTGTPIIPMIMEYYPDCCYVKWGEPLYFKKDADKAKGIQLLEEVMSTLRWDIWELFPIESRTEQMQVDFEEMVQKRVKAYPQFNLEYEISVVRKR